MDILLIRWYKFFIAYCTFFPNVKIVRKNANFLEFLSLSHQFNSIVMLRKMFQSIYLKTSFLNQQRLNCSVIKAISFKDQAKKQHLKEFPQIMVILSIMIVKKEFLTNYLKTNYESVLSAIQNRIICERLFAFQADHITMKHLSNEIGSFESYIQILENQKIKLSTAVSAAYLGLHFHFKKTIMRYLSIFKRFDKVESGIHKLNKFNHFFEYFKLISPNMTINEANKLFSLTCHEKFMRKKEVKMHSILEQAAKEGYIIGLRPNTLKCKSNNHLLKSENVSIKVASPSESMDSCEKHQLSKKKILKSKIRSMSIRVGGNHKTRFSILRFPKKRTLF